MLKFLEQGEWLKLVREIRPLLLNEQPEVVAAITINFKLEARYMVFFVKEKPVLTFLAFTTAHEIKEAIHFFYSSLWISENLSDTKYCTYLNDFLLQLQQHFKKIQIRLPVNFKDVRPFLWTNFKAHNSYTYLKSLDSLDYHEVTTKNIRKTAAKNYILKNERLTDASIELNLQIFKDFKTYTASKIDQIKKIMWSLDNAGFLTCYNIYDQEELLVSNILFLDQTHKIAYTVLLNKTKKESKDDLHSLLHHYFFTDLKAKGYEFVDLLGANLMNIAAFKARFNADLIPYFVVSYSKRKTLIDQNIDKAKILAKKVLGKLS